MSVTLYITPERPLSGVEFNTDRVLLCRIENELSDAAKSLGVAPLTSFYGYDVEEILCFIDDDDEREQMRAAAKPTQWFTAGEALSTAKSLHGYVVANGPVILKKQDVTDRVLEELQSCIDALGAATAAGVRIRMHPGE